MDGRLVPTLGGVATLMFVHRVLAAFVLLLVIWVAIRARTMTHRSKDLVILSSVTLLSTGADPRGAPTCGRAVSARCRARPVAFDWGSSSRATLAGGSPVRAWCGGAMPARTEALPPCARHRGYSGHEAAHIAPVVPTVPALCSRSETPSLA